MRPIISFLAGLIVSAAIGPGSSLAAEPKANHSADDLVRYFDTIVFQTEFEGIQPSRVVKKWTGPIRLAIRAFEEVFDEKEGREIVRLKQVRVKKPHLKFIKKHLNSLVRATGLKTEDSKKTGEPPNLMINFVPRSQMGTPNLAKANPKLLRKLAAQGGCYFLMWADGKSGKIKEAVIVVNAERLLIRINHCLLEEMTQSLGLPNDSNTIPKSIFSDRSRRTDLTRSDMIILKTLYDPRMEAGMPREDALKIAKKVIGELNSTLP